MSPKNIARRAAEMDLNIIGICDHNSCENVPYVKISAEKYNLKVLGGMEITSREEVHILALFDNDEELFSMQKVVYDKLSGTNDAKKYGDQVVVNEDDEVLEFNTKLLIGATTLAVEHIVNMIHDLNGLAIASHIDRASFSLISQLGFIPEGLNIDALEISNTAKLSDYRKLSIPLLMSSDAHRSSDIGKNVTHFTMKKPCLDELHKSLLRKDGRKAFV
jgi:PHP family Zn ribbon phosphoesterase